MRLSEKGGFSHGLPSLPRRSSLKKPLGKIEKIKDCQGESDPHDERRFHKQGILFRLSLKCMILLIKVLIDIFDTASFWFALVF